MTNFSPYRHNPTGPFPNGVSSIWSYSRPNSYYPVVGEIFQWPCAKCGHDHGVITRGRGWLGMARNGVSTQKHLHAITCRGCGFATRETYGWERLQDLWIFPEGKPDARPIPSWMIGKRYPPVTDRPQFGSFRDLFTVPQNPTGAHA